MESVVIVDVDGTLAIRNGRRPFEWSLVNTDSPNIAVVALVNDLVSLGQRIVFVTGREEWLRPETEDFIRRHVLGSHSLFMRPNGDFSSDVEVKRQIFQNQIEGKFAVRFVLDDRDRVVHFWRHELGLPTWQVGEGDF